jgi:hypothetical protein
VIAGEKSLNNRKLGLIVFLLALVIIMVTGCGNKYKNSYGYWSGTDSRDYVSYDIQITKDKELARHIEGMDKSTNSFATLALIDDDKENPYIYMTVNMEGSLSEANLYPVEKSDSPLSHIGGTNGSFVFLLIPIGLFLYLYRKKDRAR